MEGAGDTLYAVYRLIRVSECTGIQSIFDWTDNWLLLNDNKGQQKKTRSSYYYYRLGNTPFDTSKEKCDCVFCFIFPDSTRNHIRTCSKWIYWSVSYLVESFIKGVGPESLFDSAPVIPLLLGNNNGINSSYS